MRLFKCNGCGRTEEMADNETLTIHICGSGDVERICPACNNKFDFIEQKDCRHCKALRLAKQVASGEITLVDAIKS